MRLADPILAEFEQEAKTTRRVLERVPEAKLGWQPPAKSMTLGQLALHVAATPANVARLASDTPRQLPAFAGPPSPASSAEVLAAHDRSIADAKAIVGAMDDAALMATWTMQNGDKTLISMPRMGLLRAIMLNHWYHHRGQLSVYLRLLDVPLPSIYGPSADENPFG